MYELYPYFTNDGTVGLFSRQNDDIYHSTYGALTESWEKFIIPAHLEQYMAEHGEVNILDICYGIGYNSKTALNVFVNQALNADNNNSSKNKNNLNEIKLSENSENFSKNVTQLNSSIGAIYTDNINKDKNSISGYEIEKIEEIICVNSKMDAQSSGAIGSDNISTRDNEINYENDTDKCCCSHEDNTISKNRFCNKISIDAVDVDKTLIYLSPFIAEASMLKFLFEKDYQNTSENKIRYQQLKSLKKSKKFLKKEYRLKKEVSIILLEKMFERNPEFINDKILQIILSNKKYSPYVSKFMSNLAKLYSNQGYKQKQKSDLTALLHNIYYRYVSRSYKKAHEILNSTKIDINFHKNDARAFVKASNKTYNFIFLDAFTPAKCPALWTVQFFEMLYDRLQDDGMILTYSNSAAIRNAFLQNDFYVGKIYDKDTKKFAGTIATKNKKLIEYELDELDLELVSSKAGICYYDKTLDADNNTILKNRDMEFDKSTLVSSTRVMKGHKNANK